MSTWNTGTKNGMWRGGKSIASNGYVLVRVGTSHHLSDVRGYAYEHRLVAEVKLGRRLKPKEVVHHKDGVRTNNAPNNLEIESSQQHHMANHRSSGLGLRNPGEPNQTILCHCGCGLKLKKFDRSGRPRRFIYPHHCRLGPRRGGRLERVQ